MPEEAGWYPDPKNEAPFRFYDGRKWTKSVADQQPGAERVDDGPVEGGLLGLLEHQPVNEPLQPEAARPSTSGYVPLDQHIPLQAPSWAAPLPEGEEPAAPGEWAPPAAPPQAAPPPPPPPSASPPPPPPSPRWAASGPPLPIPDARPNPHALLGTGTTLLPWT